MPPRVLFVSKPVAPPFHDGSKNLVRDIARHLVRAEATVLTTPGAPDVGPRVRSEPVYRDGGRFAPSVLANARVLTRLLTGDPHDLWQFVFAPNRASSGAGALARSVRRALGWRGRVVQTVASAPQSFDGVARLLFGDRVVALSEWTRARLVGAGFPRERVRVIAPCAERPVASEEARRAVRAQLGDAPFVLFPGDFEVSSAAQTLAHALPRMVRVLPELRVVFACRPKTKRARAAENALFGELARLSVADRARSLGEVADMPALLAEAALVVFPVDSLHGKVDLPLVLLEALSLGVPLVLAKGGPLEEIRTAEYVEPRDAQGLATTVVALLRDDARRAELSLAGRERWRAAYTPERAAQAHEELYDELLKGSP